ncbi:MAG: FtsX-like permease family protein [Bacteroidota bacterium]|nr:FtsX-like permease family protein [Bacteroidota bacterium]
MIWSISWRNVWRNKLRSSVVIIAIAIGLSTGVFSTAFMSGWMNQRLDNAVKTEISHIQIHKEKFKENNETSYYIKNADLLTKKIRKIEEVKGVSKRIIINSMVASAESGTGVSVIGINPENEKNVTDIYDKIIKGKYFEGVSKNPVIIGEKLAKKLDVDVRNKIVITIQDMDNNIIKGAFRIAGIYKTSNTGYDGSHIFVNYNDIIDITGLSDGDAHEIAIYLSDNKNIDGVLKNISSFAPEGLLTESWKEISPELGLFDEMMELYMYIIVIIVLFALCFAIINTMLMVVLERVRELGMLMAVGMNKLKIFSMIILETVFLSLTGGVIGIVIGVVASMLSSKTGIDLSLWGEGLEEIGFATVIYPSINLENVISITFFVIITGIISALYPAFKALKLNPAETLRAE